MQSAPPTDPFKAPDNAITIKDLTKIYRGRGGKTALREVSLSIPRGSFFGLLGPNGAGKSTMINIMAGLVMKTSGTVRVWEYDIDRNPLQSRCAIGVVPQELNLDPFFTPRELLEVQAGMYGVPAAARRTDAILEAVGLTAQAGAYARTLSGGMRRRLLVAKAMVHSPPILVLDEPTAGVDVDLRRQLWAMLRQLNASGTTILLTTHYLEEAQSLCDRVAIINHGRLIACDTTEALLRTLDSKVMTVTVDRATALATPELAALGIEAVGADRLQVRYRRGEAHMEDVLTAIRATGMKILDLSTEETRLEDIFLHLTRQEPG
ncbi:MAG: ABC transporter ATP-binding protein [Alphaproteobacteria bacterium]|nr:ABC transporter ATP-binding protein [Alphaproteobacteria bacterium]